MSDDILGGKDGLDLVVLGLEATAQMRCGLRDGQVVGVYTRLRHNDVCVGRAALDLVFNALLQALSADNIHVGILDVQSASISMRPR